MSRRWKDLAIVTVRIVLALACGVAAGTVLNLTFFWVPALLHPTPEPANTPPLLSNAFLATVTAMASLNFGAVIAALCVPVWLWLGRSGRQMPLFAAGLGFLMTFLVYVLADGWPPPPSWGIVKGGAGFACVGAICGLVVWTADRGLKRLFKTAASESA